MKLDYHVVKGVVNAFFSPQIGGRRRGVFLEIDRVYPALNQVTQAYPSIRAELDQLLEAGPAIPSYQQIDPGEEPITRVDPHKQWSVFLLYLLGHKPAANRAICPRTCEVLARVPGLMQAFFSILEPGKSIPLHQGPYLGYLRYHLALRVPHQTPPRIVVHSQPYTWREGEAVLFDDTWPHEVVNRSTELRAVLIVDVLRPMPLPAAAVNRFMTFAARHTYGRKVLGRIEAQAAVAPLRDRRRPAA